MCVYSGDYRPGTAPNERNEKTMQHMTEAYTLIKDNTPEETDVVTVSSRGGDGPTVPRSSHSLVYGDAVASRVIRKAYLLDPPHGLRDVGWIMEHLRTRIAPGGEIIEAWRAPRFEGDRVKPKAEKTVTVKIVPDTSELERALKDMNARVGASGSSAGQSVERLRRAGTPGGHCKALTEAVEDVVRAELNRRLGPR